MPFRTAAVVALLSLTPGCFCSPPPMPVVDAGPLGACFQDSDCPRTPLTFCNTVTSQCTPGCAVKADCSATVRKELALPECAGPLGCECDLGRCAPVLCTADSDCDPTQACRDGACVTAPADSAVARCEVSPDFAILRQGAKATFSVLAWDAKNAPVVLKTAPTWNPVGPTVLAAGPGAFTGNAPNASAQVAVRATLGSASCTAKVWVLPDTAPAADALDVLVTDELTGRPIAAAAVLASVPTTGAPIGAAATTSATGRVTLPGLGAHPEVTVTAFHADYGYLTVAGYRLSGSRVLSLVLRRNPMDKLGGYRGTVKDAPLTSNFHLGLAGTSLPGLATDLSLTDLTFASLVGRNVPTRFKIGTAVDDPNVPLPAGLFVGFTEPIKSRIAALGLAGICTDATGAPDEPAIAAGTCGTRVAWGFAGDVPLGDLPIDQFRSGFAGVNFLEFFKRIRPVFWRFQSNVARDVGFTLAAPPKTADGGVVLDFDAGLPGAAIVDQSFAAVPVALDLAVRVPPLPPFKTGTLDTALVFGGSFAPGRGFVPLGMGVAEDKSPVDALTDAQSVPNRAGIVSLRSAPPHHGLEGSPYGVVALALRTKPDVMAGLASSVVLTRVPDTALKFDQVGAHAVDLGLGFPPVPARATHDYLTRAFAFANVSPGDVRTSLTQVVFTDQAEHAWVVVAEASATGFTLPTPPGTFADRTFFTGMTTGERSPFFVRKVRLDDGARVSFDQAVELGAAYAGRFSDALIGFSVLDHQRPTITWTIPSFAGTAVAKGSAVVVTVRNFQVGTDGSVRLRITPATAGCPDAVTATDASNGKGEIVLTVPSTCVLAGAELTATLMTPAGAEVLPPVSSVRRANIQ